MAAIRRPVRSRPIRVLLIGMFAVPLVSLVALWALATVLTVPAAINDHDYQASSQALNGLAVRTVTISLPTERQESYIWLLSGRTASKAALLATRKAVDQALPAARAAFASEGNNLGATSKSELATMLSTLGQLDSIRQQVDAGTISAPAAFSAYSGIVDSQFQFYDSSASDRGANLVGQSIGATDAGYALEMASREVALADGAVAVNRGRLSPAAHALFTSSAADRQQLLAEALGLLPTTLRNNYLAALGSATAKQFQTMEQQISNASTSVPMPVDGKTWTSVSGAYLGLLAQTEFANGAPLQAASSAASDGLLTEAILAGGVGLAAVVASVFLLVWFGRRMTRDLTRLHGSVREMSEQRLPRVVDRLRRGDDVDVAAESPPPVPSRVAEIAQIARSFGVVQEAAVAAAVDQAQLRKGVNQVFLNISMRNQSLLHRQLSMLDTMERRTSDPGALADLFRLDHLTTRMRRHAEGLIILSGSTPGRGWRDPVPVVDVLRAAVAEVEDYVRVDVVSESRDLVAGSAVNDVIHLVAELVENATVFSPPNTRIEVRADRAGTGVVAEIDDRGLGLTDEELDSINRRLASPPEFDLANSEQLGLFVVSRLAARHAIKVSLRHSVYGGTTAILVLPFGVIVREEGEGGPASQGDTALAPQSGDGLAPGDDSDPDSAAEESQRQFGPTGRHRLAATGRRADTGLSDRNGRPEPGPGPQALPPPPWGQGLAGPAQPGPEQPGRSAAVPGRPPWEMETATPWAEAFSRSTDAYRREPLGPNGTAPGSRPTSAPPAGSQPGVQPGGPTASGSHLGMPIRVPQANLAPQLRSPGQGQGPGSPAQSQARDVDERAPEETRNMMILMQQGWERGRVDNLERPLGAPADGTER
jgi:signal transduction histidine kinase